MKLTWMPPRKLKFEDALYPQVRHWLVDGDGRILAAITEPSQENPEDSFDARLYYTNIDDTGYFISLEHAQSWCERRARIDTAEGERKAAALAAIAVEAAH